jgi:hypothetical protein
VLFTALLGDDDGVKLIVVVAVALFTGKLACPNEHV